MGLSSDLDWACAFVRQQEVVVKSLLFTPSFINSNSIIIIIFKRELRRGKGEKERRRDRNTQANTFTQRREKSQPIPAGMSRPLQPKATAQHKSTVVFGRAEPTPVKPLHPAPQSLPGGLTQSCSQSQFMSSLLVGKILCV